MKYYKAFDKVEGNPKAGICRGLFYEEGKEYSIEGSPEICKKGSHFCREIVLTSEYYDFDLDKTVYAEVEVLGDIDWELPTKHKGCTNKIKIVKFLSPEFLESLTDSNDNSGYRNSGNYNSGDYNSGGRNSGNYNSGGRNSGDWNATHHETGYFNSTQSETINVFNKPCARVDWNFEYIHLFENGKEIKEYTCDSCGGAFRFGDLNRETYDGIRKEVCDECFTREELNH